jgi:suppressor of G2 allele of SKP1
MSVSIFSKGIDKDKFQVEFLPFSVRLDPVVYPSGDSKEFQINLWGEIEPSESKYTVTPNKVELNLRKKMAGKWPTLRGEAVSAEKTVKADEANGQQPT